MKKLLTTIFIFASLMLVLTGCKSGNPEFTFELVSKDSYMVSVADANNAKKIVIPDTYNGKPVTAIKQNGFANIASVKEIIVPDSIEILGSKCFSDCVKLTRVELGKGVKELGNNLSVYVESNNGSVIGSITVLGPGGNSNFVISDYFIEVEATDYTEEAMVSFLSISPFTNCKNLKSIEVSSDNQTYKSIDGNLYSKDGTKLIQYASGKKDKSFDISEGVTTIADEALVFCANLEKLSFPASLETFEHDTLHSYMFLYGASSLKEIYVNEGNTVYKSIDGNLYTKDGKQFLKYAPAKEDKKFAIPEGVESIYHFAFIGCEKLESLTIPSSVKGELQYPSRIAEFIVDEKNAEYKSIDGALYSKDGKTLIIYPKCKENESYTTPAGVETIVSGAFSDAENLKTVVIGDSVKTIGSSVFTGCTNLENLIIGNGVERIEGRFFTNDTKIKYNEYGGALYLGNDANPYLVLMKAKDKSITSCDVNAKTRIIYYSAFEECMSLSKVSIPDTVIQIGSHAFAGCQSLTSVNIPNGINEIASNVFRSCHSLTEIDIPANVTKIGISAFADCRGLLSIDIPEGITEIPSGAFNGCNRLAEVTIPDSVTTIGSNAFASCWALTEIDIPESVTKIDNLAFYQCRGLTSITIPSGVEKIEARTFNQCINLKNVVISDGVKTIKAQAFDGCRSLMSIVIPASVTEIDNSAFRNCDQPITVYYTGSEEQWSELKLDKIHNLEVYFDYVPEE